MAEPVYRRVVVKLSGEYLAGPHSAGIDQATVDRIAGDLIAASRLGVEIADEPSFRNPRVVADHTRADFSNPGAAIYRLSLKGQKARLVRVTATRLPFKSATPAILESLVVTSAVHSGRE